jgi:hypothetical protein
MPMWKGVDIIKTSSRGTEDLHKYLNDILDDISIKMHFQNCMEIVGTDCMMDIFPIH